MRFDRFVLIVFVAALFPFATPGADWPMWRYDAARSAASPEELPGELHLQWIRRYEARTPVWENPLNRDLMRYDTVFEPVVAEGLVFIGFNDSDKVVALDSATGEQRWVFYTDGPVRLPPAVHENRLFFVSDDGHLYCLDAKTGEQVWKLRGGPDNRKILGNSRLISIWPARGGPVVVDNTVYFAAGIWPFMGTFIYAVDAGTGDVVWLNDHDGPTYQEQPHGGAWAFGGVGPQGAFSAVDDKLIVPGGRSVPAVLDRATGEVLHYRFHDNNKTGGAFVCVDSDVFFNHHRERYTNMYDIETGDVLAQRVGKYPVVSEDRYYFSGEDISAFDANEMKAEPKNWRDAELWELEVDASGDLIKSGSKLYAGGENGVTVVQLPKDTGDEASVVARIPVKGTVKRLVAANGRLFVVTLDGKVLGFGPEDREPRKYVDHPDPQPVPDKSVKAAQDILDQQDVRSGYALFYGIDDGTVLKALAEHTELHIIAFDPDAAKVEKARCRLDQAGLYGDRVAVHAAGLLDAPTPAYLASLTIVYDCPGELNEATITKLYASMHPYHGKIWFRDKADPASPLFQAMHELGIDDMMRTGGLEGAASWQGVLGDVAQTGKSDDKSVRLPLGLLWFGGNSNERILPRHGHGPPEQVVDGRLFIEGMNCLEARDVYTGRVLWQAQLPDFDTFNVYYDKTYKDMPTSTFYNQVHIPGANIRSTNFFATEDYVYVLQTDTCHMLNARTGETERVLELPPHDDQEDPEWGYLGVYEDLLIGGAGRAEFTGKVGEKPDKAEFWSYFDVSASEKLVVMDRYTGEVKWTHESEHGFLHNGIAIGNGILFCLDKPPPYIESLFERRGRPSPDNRTLTAFDLATGEIKWRDDEDPFGSFLSYSEEHDILLQSLRPSRDQVEGEHGRRIKAYRGRTGEVLWDKGIIYPTFPLLHGDTFITELSRYDLATGELVEIPNPLTGEPMPWKWHRHYGCNHPTAAENMLLFRSGAAGYYDLAHNGGTGNWGGFKSGCTSNLVAADGLLNAPEYTRTCSCSYPNQCSLALVHMPDVEVWTFNDFDIGDEPIRRLGINLGAPGDRKTDDGALWLEFPVVGGPSPDISAYVAPDDVEWYRDHSTRYARTGYPWVGASGGIGISEIAIKLAEDTDEPRAYKVQLYFAEPHDLAPGDRVFDVSIQGEPVLKSLDIVEQAGQPRKGIVKSFENVIVEDELKIAIAPDPSSEAAPILCGVEIAAQGW